ncbi:MAG: glutamine synthetase III [Oscillospiraceae bacterium]
MSEGLFSTFGSHLFDDRVMRERLPENIYNALRAIRDEGMVWQSEVADVVARAMKDWAMELGATHYVHWFSPMTGAGSGKHDSFIDGVKDGVPILHFSGKMLAKGESDASSFPSGGLRATFEARGYTTWDPTSPAFVLGTTLYIPTAFCAYTGEALDAKTPVLRSMQALNKQALRVLRSLGDKDTLSVRPTVGAEQEYFLIDKELFDKRLDLKVCGHTLLGAKPPKGQEMGDHYYGSINERVRKFMRELDDELWLLGVPAKTEHNEAAPCQFELASVFSTANIACDHNQIMMELMCKIALRHGFACLLHEKPYAGVNGSGKHNNWSIVTNSGKNLLDPGENAAQNPVFLLMICAVLTAVDKYAELLRLSASCPGNEARLGGHEAPPAIISVFLGSVLTSVIRELAEGHTPLVNEKNMLLTGVKSLPLLTLDDNDRNRTSPFAFTGNKFEFRMVGSSQSIGLANAVTNAIVADVLHDFADKLENAGNTDAVISEIIADTWHNHKKIVFNGNNYSAEWQEEAHRRGLPQLESMVDAAEAFIDEKNVKCFERTKVFTQGECYSRHEVMLEQYIKTAHIDAATMYEMVSRSLLPASYEYLSKVSKSACLTKQAGAVCKSVNEAVRSLSRCIDSVSDAVEALKRALHDIETASDKSTVPTAQKYKALAKNEMASLRIAADELEGLVPQSFWPMPDYCELLFTY